jgi:RimJ/RimL family protein N-acetyltransferase
MMAPTLTTARLVLRPMALADFPATAAFLATDRSRYMGGPYDVRGAWGTFCHDVALWSLSGHGALMIEAEGVTVGQVGLNAGPLYPETELGWLLFQGYEGRGYATEAAAALRDWGFANLSVTSLVSYMDHRNHASARVAERLGAVLDPNAQRQSGPGDEDDLVYRHHRGAA